MSSPIRKSATRQDWVALARRAFQSNDLRAAKVAYIEALNQDRRNGQLHHELALTLAALAEIDDAAIHFTRALRFKPSHEEAARRLSRLLARFAISEPARLDPFGLKAALGASGIDTQPVAETALAHLSAAERELERALHEVAAGQADEAARKLLLNRTADVLKSDLLMSALQAGIVMNPWYERLFTALRRVLLLEVAPDRFQDRALYAFALSLLAQVWNNDHVWAETEAETKAIEQIAIDKELLFAGDLEMARRLLLCALYRPLESVLAPDDAAKCNGIRPKPLRDAVQGYLINRDEERRAAREIPRLAPITDEVSQRVARQYETNPYPRWQSLHVSRPGAMKATLTRYFAPERLAFMDGSFDVLIAGAGTGKQALQSALAYGPNARVLATDLSAASLGYAQCAARRYGVTNVEFMVVDILDLARIDRQFDIIECLGVLHHMADPWAGWRMLLSRLKPGGLMYIGLYSATARANIRALREQPDYPGPDCDDQTARNYRAQLLNSPAGTPGADLAISRDFYTLHEFRDLVLHPCEQHVTLDEIARFLDENGLVFRGFTLDPLLLQAFASEFLQSTWPGALSDWKAFEQARPRLFEAMYRFWCERLPAV